MAISDFANTVRRLRTPSRLSRRSAEELQYATAAGHLPRKLLYDSTVYIDVLQGRISGALAEALQRVEIWHSAVAESELAILCGVLDPREPGTTANVQRIVDVVDRWPAQRVIAPDREIWREAGVLAGRLARIQSYSRSDRRRALNDSLIFATGRENGVTVLTRNVADFDLLQQLDPRGHVIFYAV